MLKFLVLGYAKEDVTIGDTQLQSPYNTYVSKGSATLIPIGEPPVKALDAVPYLGRYRLFILCSRC